MTRIHQKKISFFYKGIGVMSMQIQKEKEIP